MYIKVTIVVFQTSATVHEKEVIAANYMRKWLLLQHVL